MDLRSVLDLSDSKHGLDPSFVTHCTKVLIAPHTKAIIYLVGTAHVSNKSAEDVAKVIRIVRPDTIVLELCNARAGLLLGANQVPKENEDTSLSISQLREAISQKGGVTGVLHLLLSNMYKKVASKIKIAPGLEFQRAYEEGKKIPSKFILGDRPIEITLQRSWALLSFYDKTRFMWHLIKDSNFDVTEDDIEKLKSNDIITELMSEFMNEFPSLANTLITERDMYLSGVLQSAPGQVVVGVVGLGHLRGIVDIWNKPHPNMESLLHIPQSESYLWSVTKLVLITTGALGAAFTLFKYLKPK